MILLVDYDNLGELKKNNSLSEIIRILLKEIPLPDGTLSGGIICRLYGGWLHKGNQLTRRARRLSREIERKISFDSEVSNQERMMKLQLATSLACDVQNDFPNTYRTRLQSPPTDFRRFPLLECTKSGQCPISAVMSFHSGKSCMHADCKVTKEKAFRQSEQKMVDSMIIVDLIHFAIDQQKKQEREHIVLVSGDNDMWLGIRYALLENALITHIIPKQSRGKMRQFRQFHTDNYTSILL